MKAESQNTVCYGCHVDANQVQLRKFFNLRLLVSYLLFWRSVIDVDINRYLAQIEKGFSMELSSEF